MSDTLMKLVITQNGEEYLPLTAEEIAQMELDAVANAEITAQREAQAAARASAIAKIASAAGLTPEEIATL